MPDHAQPGALPLRPLTTGELLDAAVVLLRTQAGRLLGIGALLALIEQAILFPLRRLADVDSSFLPADERLFEFGFVMIAGLALEAGCIALLGGLAATQAPRALLGAAAPPQRSSRLASVIILAMLVGIACGATGWAFLVLPVPLQVAGLLLALVATATIWPFVYGLTGLATPAAVIDQLGVARALGRSLRLAARTMMRATSIQVLGYVVWLAVRVGLGIATVAAIEIFYSSPSPAIDNVIMGATWLVVNSIAYPMLGCLAAVVHLDVRMRTEGLDIAIRRSVRRGVATDAALAVPR